MTFHLVEHLSRLVQVLTEVLCGISGVGSALCLLLGLDFGDLLFDHFQISLELAGELCSEFFEHLFVLLLLSLPVDLARGGEVLRVGQVVSTSGE